MPYATTIFPAKDALHTLLQGWAWPAPAPTVAWGPPTKTEDRTGYDAIYQGAVEDIDDAKPTLGARVDEQFTLQVVVDVARYGDDERGTEQRAWELCDAVYDLLLQNPDLSGTVNRLPAYTRRVVTAPGGVDHWRSQIVIRIAAVGHVLP